MVPHNKHYLMLFLIAMLLPFTHSTPSIVTIIQWLHQLPQAISCTITWHNVKHEERIHVGNKKSSNNDLTFYFKIACFCLSPNMSIINDPNIFQINIATKNNLLSISRTYLLFSLYLQFYILAKQPATLHSTHEYWIFIPLLSMIV